MPFGAQTGELFSVFDRLDPDDANITVPTVDPSSITPVFPIDPAWLGLNTIALRSANQSISGATGDFSDTDNSEFTNQFPPSVQFDISTLILFNRRYVARIRIGGGTTPPWGIARWAFPGITAFEQADFIFTNPGSVSMSVFVPRGAEFNIQIGGGGGSDVANVNLTGIYAKPGVPLPTLDFSIDTTHY